MGKGLLCPARLAPHLCHPEICEFRHALLIDQDIAGLDVSMDDVATIDGLDCPADITGYAYGLLYLQGSSLVQVLLQAAPIDVLHHQVHVALGIDLQGIRGDDVGVGKPANRACLLLEARPVMLPRLGGLPGFIVQQLLYGHMAFHPLIGGKVDPTKVPLADDGEDPVFVCQ